MRQFRAEVRDGLHKLRAIREGSGKRRGQRGVFDEVAARIERYHNRRAEMPERGERILGIRIRKRRGRRDNLRISRQEQPFYRRGALRDESDMAAGVAQKYSRGGIFPALENRNALSKSIRFDSAFCYLILTRIISFCQYFLRNFMKFNKKSIFTFVNGLFAKRIIFDKEG